MPDLPLLIKLQLESGPPTPTQAQTQSPTEFQNGDGGEQLSAAYLAEYSGGILIGNCVACAALTTAVLALRFYAKRFHSTGIRMGIDDVFIGVAYVGNLAVCALGIVSVQIGGVGYHIEAALLRDPNAAAGWAKSVFAFELVHFTTVALPKMAILLLYLRVFAWPRGGLMHTTAVALLTTTAVISTAFVVAACLQCRPLAYWWDRDRPGGGECFDVQLFFRAQALPGPVMDLLIMALPVGTVWRLRLPAASRVALLGVFMVASLGVVVAIFRAVVFFSTEALEDRTWASVHLIGWSIIEPSAYIITACLPHLRPLVSYYTPPRLKDVVRRIVPGRRRRNTHRGGRLARGRGSAIIPDGQIVVTTEVTLESYDRDTVYMLNAAEKEGLDVAESLRMARVGV